MVRSLDLSIKGICQNPEFASSLLKIFAPANCAKVSSTFGRLRVYLPANITI